MFQCEVWPGHPASGGYGVHAPVTAVRSPDEEGGVGGGLEPGGVSSSLLTQPGVQQLPAGTSKHFTAIFSTVTVAPAGEATTQRVAVSGPRHVGQGAGDRRGGQARGPQLRAGQSLTITSPSSGD